MYRKIRKALLALTAISSLSLLYSCHVGRFFIWNFADIKDYKKFPSYPVLTGEDVGASFTFKRGEERPLRDFFKSKIRDGGKLISLEKALVKTQTVAFLIIRNDSILYENYPKRYSEESIFPSFSMAKSVVSTLVGIAVKDGKIKSVNQPITDYLKFLDKKKFEKITIENLLDMRSGIEFKEAYYSPFADVAKYYYGKELMKYLSKMKVKRPADERFEYISINTLLLGLIVEQATGIKLNEYLQERIWKPLGMEYEATWSIDSEEDTTIKSFCCLNARARDFAKLGRLYLKRGKWNKVQIVPQDWVSKSVKSQHNKNRFRYSYNWWHTVNYDEVYDTTLIPDPKLVKPKTDLNNTKPKYIVMTQNNDYYMSGFLGQYVYVFPDKNLILVRLGKKEGDVNWPQMLRDIAERL